GAPRREQGSADAAAWNGAGRGRRRLFSPRPRNDPGRGGPRGGGARGLEGSLGHLLQHVDVESLVGHDLLEPGVLFLHGLQAGDPLGTAALVLSLPPLVGLNGDPERPADLLHDLARPEQPFRLTDLSY